MAEPVTTWGYLKSDNDALPLEPGCSYRVGRKPDCQLVLKVRRHRSAPRTPPPAHARVPLQSRSVSGEHAVIKIDKDGKQGILNDLNSLNGCFVNNMRIKGLREVLTHGPRPVLQAVLL